MSAERSTKEIWANDVIQQKYDEHYYSYIINWIKGDVLDIGCGVGLFIERYKNKANKVIGLDKFPKGCRIKGDNVIHLDWKVGEDLPKPYIIMATIIVATEFIEHITKGSFLKLLEQIKEAAEVFIGSTPNKIIETTEHIQTSPNPYHLYEWTLNELKEVLEKNYKEVEIFDKGHNCIIWKASFPLL